MSKKPLYFGDPDTPYSMCSKKARRHSRADLSYMIVPQEGIEDQEAKPVVAVFCRHCKESPIKQQGLIADNIA